MHLVTSFVLVLQPLQVGISERSFANLSTVLCGWVFAARHTVSQMIGLAEDGLRKHHSAFYRLFAQARWSRDVIGLVVFGIIEPWLGDGPVYLAVDDTLARKRGRRVFGVGMHHDPLLSSRRSRRELGTQLGRAGGVDQLSAVAQTNFLFAGAVSLVSQSRQRRT